MDERVEAGRMQPAPGDTVGAPLPADLQCMLHTPPRRECCISGETESGFTLIELLVVVLVMAILIAIAVPTFAGFRDRAHDARAQSNIANALRIEGGYYAEEGRYTANTSELRALDPKFDWTQSDATMNGVLPAAPGAVIDPGYDVDGDGSHNCSVSTSNGVTTVSGDCYLDAVMVCLVSVSASGRKLLAVSVGTGAEAGTYYNEGVDCPNDPSGVLGWSTSGW